MIMLIKITDRWCYHLTDGRDNDTDEWTNRIAFDFPESENKYEALARKLQTQESEGQKSEERAENVQVNENYFDVDGLDVEGLDIKDGLDI